jgi:hypothetical protein
VIFNSSVPIGTSQGVYMAAAAEEVIGEARVAAMGPLLTPSLGHGGREWTLDDVEPPAEVRLYRATASAHYILGSIDRLVAVNLLR